MEKSMVAERLSNKDIGENLRYLRKLKKTSAKEIADELGISVKTYYAYEAGTREIPLDVFIDIANIFNCSLDDLVTNNRYSTGDTVIKYECFKKEGSSIKRCSAVRLTTILDNIICVREGNDILFFMRSDTIVNGMDTLYSYKDKYYIGKLYKDESGVTLEQDGVLIKLKKKDLEELLVFGLYQGKLSQLFKVDGFF